MGLGWDPQIPVLTSSEYGLDESFASVYYVILGLQNFRKSVSFSVGIILWVVT